MARRRANAPITQSARRGARDTRRAITPVPGAMPERERDDDMSTEETHESVRGDDPASGMTIRERFAMAAMQSISVSATIARRTLTPWQVADAAVTQADALLAALEARHDGE